MRFTGMVGLRLQSGLERGYAMRRTSAARVPFKWGGKTLPLTYLHFRAMVVHSSLPPRP